MKADQASWTAEITAIFRATESMRPPAERLLQDPYAVHFLRPSLRWVHQRPRLAMWLLWFFIDRRFPGICDTAVSRIRFVDDCLRARLADGIDQVVLLGAGYDARAYRFEALKHKRVFEVDHPSTQKLKRAKLQTIFNPLPGHVRFVPVDFEKERLPEKLSAAGYDPSRRTLFIWEGVCKYLTAEAVDALLAFVAGNSSKGSAIVFDYLFRSMIERRLNWPLADKMLAFQEKKGEPFIFGLPENEAEAEIRAKGFSQVTNATASRIKAAYFKNGRRGKNLHLFWGMIQATV